MIKNANRGLNKDLEESSRKLQDYRKRQESESGGSASMLAQLGKAGLTQMVGQDSLPGGERLHRVRIYRTWGQIGTMSWDAVGAYNWDGEDQRVERERGRCGRSELLKGAPAKETPADADGLILVDARNQKTGKLLWSQVKAVLKGWMDTLYAAAGHSHGWSAIIGQLSALTARSQSQGWRQRCADGGRYGGAAWFVGSCLGSVPIVATNDQTPTLPRRPAGGIW